MHFYSYLKTALEILAQYQGGEPFASFLKKFFSQQKKYGSNDRKQISQLCYCYFRLGKALFELTKEERILTGLFLCSTGSSEVLEQLKPGWNKSAHLSIKEKCSILNGQFSILNVFPSEEQLSEKLDHEKFCESFLIQPDLFLRLRSGYENIVKEKLLAAKIDFKEANTSCLALHNTSKIDSIIELDKEAVVQDYNSQKIGDLFRLAIQNLESLIAVWDCCAASGGKSLLLYDINPFIDLTVSDIRESILSNLKKRFAKAGIKKYNSFVIDLTQPDINHQISNFDLIIADVPCTGSGTWSRTPEQLYFFDKKKIEQYVSLQKKIISNIIANLKKNGFLIYITCSVFKKENEEMVTYIKQEFNLELVKIELLKGYDKKADTMFAALMKKTL